MSIVLQTKEGEPKKNDAIHLINLPNIDSYINDIYIDNRMFTFLKRLPIISYIGNIKRDDVNNTYLIQIKRNKTGAFDKEKADWYPIELFQLVKVPRISDIVDWFYLPTPYQTVNDFPDDLKIFKSEINQISKYIIEIFCYNPKWLAYLNKHLNHLYLNNDPIEVFILIKNIIQINRIPKESLLVGYVTRNKRELFVKVVQELNPEMCTKDAIALWDLNRKYVLASDEYKYKSNEDRLEDYLYPGRRQSKEEEDELNKRISELKQQAQAEKFKNDDRFLKEITQEIIDDLELTIFDISVLEDVNQILFTFIDKDNNKKFYIEDLYYEFYISNKDSIIENDYIVNKENCHKMYCLSSYDNIRNLNYAINSTYSKFMKGDYFNG